MDFGADYSGAKLRTATRLMLISLVVMLVAIFTIYFTPLATAPIIAASLYVSLWIYERKVGVASPITRLMTVFYLLFALLRHWIETQLWVAYSSPAIYLTLATLIFALLLADKPFTAFYAGEAAMRPLQRMMSFMWGGLHLAAGLAGLLLIPGLGFLYIPLGLMVFGAMATVWLNFVSMGSAHERKSQFDLGGYSFREVKTLKDWDAFYKVAANAYRSDLQKAIGTRRKIDSQVIAREHRASDGKREGSFLAFIAIENCQPVGTICIFFDHGEHGLPIEGEANIDLGPWRHKGAVAEIGRLSLIRTHRFNPFLLKGLFKCVVEAAAEKSIWFIFNDSFVFQRRIYEKIGFSALFEKPYLSSDENSTGYGLKVLPMVMNLVRMIRMDEETSMASDLRGILAPYVIERFFKRLAIRETLGLLPCLKHNIRETQDAKT